jgi:ubiquinone/menaquinone biosynthesis C-methylase UbiE
MRAAEERQFSGSASPTQDASHPLDPKTANLLYHDAVARSYDAKWAIAFDDRCISYVRRRAERMLPRPRYGRVLEVGCGTGFFILNLWQSGYVQEAHACDLSPGMLAVCAESARTMGCDLKLRTADAERLPFEDESFDLVVGHAFLHHLPEPAAAISEAHRVLAPGGTLWIAGEPTLWGDRMARAVGRTTHRAYDQVARIIPRLRRPPALEPVTADERVCRELEWHVDLHTFEPDAVARMAREAGFVRIRVETEELVSSLAGWAVRTIEAEVPPGVLGRRWGSLAYRIYLALYEFDQRLLYRVIPKRIFYNLHMYGEKRSHTGVAITARGG